MSSLSHFWIDFVIVGSIECVTIHSDEKNASKMNFFKCTQNFFFFAGDFSECHAEMVQIFDKGASRFL
jgi:hypothetical protein